MNRALWKGVAAVSAAIAIGVLGASANYGAKVIKTSPPWASDSDMKEGLKLLGLMIQASVVQSAWWRCVNAVEAKQSQQTVDALINQLDTAKATYRMMSGQEFIVSECRQ